LTNDRARIDPENRYPADGFRQAEELAIRVLECLPDGEVERTQDAIQIEHGGERGLVVLVTAEAVEIRLPTTEWTQGAYGPTPSSRLWKRVRAARVSEGQLELADLLRKAREARAREFKVCRYCKEVLPVEHRHGNVCHACSERFEGVVH
jgi:hypothetical protein